MTQQITLLGGQILPVYLGILEKKPDVVHVIYTKETRQLLPRLVHIFPKTQFHGHQVDPYDFLGIKELVTNIILENEKDEYQLNLTSGTKVMALACQAVLSLLDYEVFYIDQKHRLYSINDESFSPIISLVKINTFLALSGHKNFNYSDYSDFTKEEKEFAHEIFEQTKNKSGMQKALEAVSSQCKKADSINEFNFSNSNLSISWKNKNLQIDLPNYNLKCYSYRAFNIAFGGLWWELVVADVTYKWSKSIEHMIGVSIQTNSSLVTKNEIDIVLNTGKNLIFVECKSGNVNQGDINKIRAVNRLYGGVSSKSILVCRYIPRKDLLEKCKDLGIEVFAFQTSFSKIKHQQVTSFINMYDLLKKLDSLVYRLEIE